MSKTRLYCIYKCPWLHGKVKLQLTLIYGDKSSSNTSGSVTSRAENWSQVSICSGFHFGPLYAHACLCTHRHTHAQTQTLKLKGILSEVDPYQILCQSPWAMRYLVPTICLNTLASLFGSEIQLRNECKLFIYVVNCAGLSGYKQRKNVLVRSPELSKMSCWSVKCNWVLVDFFESHFFP